MFKLLTLCSNLLLCPELESAVAAGKLQATQSTPPSAPGGLQGHLWPSVFHGTNQTTPLIVSRRVEYPYKLEICSMIVKGVLQSKRVKKFITPCPLHTILFLRPTCLTKRQKMFLTLFINEEGGISGRTKKSFLFLIEESNVKLNLFENQGVWEHQPWN